MRFRVLWRQKAFFQRVHQCVEAGAGLEDRSDLGFAWFCRGHYGGSYPLLKFEIPSSLEAGFPGGFWKITLLWIPTTLIDITGILGEKAGVG
ncbi:unnamed protein product [Didymodactylos carnosus]|uniref:Uncharacterized protein n=1 Tax=Didymodactylos carnosus TaxID=1234261 RepID=A0A8S2U481_9BILA|nr:unnamed protein product [Didymodactylos carnosus]CAF4314341.1 unnamed protein product [Didymodactylos carnosus]